MLSFSTGIPQIPTQGLARLKLCLADQSKTSFNFNHTSFKHKRDGGWHRRTGRLLERWFEHTEKLPKLSVGDRVLIRNQCRTRKVVKRWDRSGVVLEVMEYDKYRVKVDGSGRTTMRSRQFLRKVLPYQPQQPMHRAQVQTDLEVQGNGVVDRAFREEQDQVKTMQDQVEEEQTMQEQVVQETSKSERVRKTNTMYDPDVWDLDRD